MNDKEEDDYKKQDKIEELRMIDNLAWVLRFMRNYEEKKERLKQFRITKQMFDT